MPEDTNTDTTTTTAAQTTADDDSTDGLDDGAKRVIAGERDRAKRAERESKSAARELQRAQAELEQLRNAGASEAEKQIAAARKEAAAAARADALKEANKRLVRAEIKAIAAPQMDPALAAKLLADEDFDVDDDGNVDEKSIKKAIADLLEDHPNLAANGDGKARGSFDGGARTTAPGAGDMNQLLRRAAGRA